LRTAPPSYPGSLTRDMQLALAVGVLAINLLLYGWVLFSPRGRQHS